MSVPKQRTNPDDGGSTEESRREFAKRVLVALSVGLVAMAVALALWHTAQILLLIFASILLAIFLRTLAELLSEHTPLSEGASLTIIVLLLLSILVLFAVLYGPAVADGFYQLSRQLPSALERIRSSLGHYPWGPPLLDALSRAGGSLADPRQISKIAGIFSTAFGAVGSLFVVAVLSIYFAIEPHIYLEGVKRLFPKERRARVGEALRHVGQALRWWLTGQIAAMLAVGVLTGTGLALLGVPFAFVLALVAAILDFMPNIGPLIAAIPALMVGLSVSGTTALYVSILYFVVQALEGYLITPYIQQRVVSLPPALLLAAQLLMGAGFGILGLLLAPPLTVSAMVLVQMLYERDALGEKVDLP